MPTSTLIGTKWGKANINNKGYYDIVSKKEGNFRKKCHRLIYEDYYNVCLLSFVDIHHIDGDKLNNSINNLEPLYHGEHSHLHTIGENNPMYGKRATTETRKKMSKAHSGENNSMYGKHHSVETRKKLSEANKGKPHIPETYFNKSSKNGLPFRVSKLKDTRYKQGFCYVYQYSKEGKRYCIKAVSVLKLKDKILSKSLKWDWLNYPVNRIEADDI